ncbi:uncharacterized protein LOC121185402 isoform X1 [Toxotes jaculatrix]|uniref:uncharacterized protein LOC121185402 isoform X1 n=1 Tax=Toxotes jaculatrix TaxID=941984 RepID=UPI001B3A82E9|nr:uncharacterized protein LOC121185402 isoform X1 [Toxotes jaculatrix]
MGLTTWIFLYFMVSGTYSRVAVHQPPVLTTALGNDVLMPCHLKVSHDEKVLTTPVLYWVYLTQENSRLWVPSEKYAGRVDLLDKNQTSSNKSILLKNVQWADNGKYLCKLSITTERHGSFRRKGNETLLMIYDTMIFNLTNNNESLLRCEVNVTREPGFVLSISHNGNKLQTVDLVPGDDVAALPYVTLSQTISLQSGGKYECQLHLNDDIITKNIFNYLPSTRSEEGGDAEKNIFTPRQPVSESGEGKFPEPWLLYAALLLVPSTVLLSLIIALMMCKRRV